MAVPKQRKTKSRRNQRRSHISLKEVRFTGCAKCGNPVLPHILCQNCGYYKGEMVIDVMKKLDKKEKKLKEKEIAAKEAEQGKPEQPMSMEELSKK